MKILSSGLTDVGMKREGNEDSFVCSDALGLYVVADGMGGHAAGEVASGAAIETITNLVQESTGEEDQVDAEDGAIERHARLMETSVHQANSAICGLSKENPSYAGMGTTLSGMLARRDKAVVVHVGDSRIYRLRDGALRAITNDHSWVNEQLQRNLITAEEARHHRWRNVITRALGNKPEVEVDTMTLDLEIDDCYLLCSDGLTGMVEDAALADCLGQMEENLEAACRDLIEQAKQAGGDDNITAIILRVTE